ncbi:protein IN2-1 homolog B isoform X3 [Ziziphus jujuba]|uniref:Protein IN2-1 homolog B isoform X3 n=1 Tax=Ziziphus jujuba TaxID=326968 RepID=A0ABM3IEV3_ZIZJJ|nr:protein IN2-1 homolog B isoform X3 [Ziziphus jujuba]
MSYSSFTTASSSSPLTYPRKFSDSISFSNKFVLIRFPKTHILSSTKIQQKPGFGRSKAAHFTTMATTGSNQEVLPPAFTSTSDPPPVFDGNTRLYISYQCPYAQRVWITRNVKVPSLEHNNKVIGESLDLIKYIDSQFKGPSLFPDDPARIEFAEELLSQSGSVHKSVTSSFKGEVEESGAAFDYIETALSKFEDGPFFLGQFSLVDIAYAPFIERYQLFLLDVKKYDITEGRPKLKAWIEEINKIEGYRQTRNDPKELVESYKKRFLVQV